MIEYDPKELAEVIWQKNVPGATPLALVKEDQPERVKVYTDAARAAIEWFIDKTLEREGSAVEVAAALAEELALKYNHPGWFVDGVRDTFDRYAELVGEENLSDEIRKARKL